MAVPTYDRLYNPVLQSLHDLGGSGSTDEIEDRVVNILNLSDEDVSEIHRRNTTKLTYRLAWARNYLKRFGLLENSARGVWALTPVGRDTKTVDRDEVNKKVKSLDRQAESIESVVAEGQGLEELGKFWETELLEELLSLTPEGFERLCQRVLRESGFVQVEVTGKVGDGGIDGRGVMKVGGLFSFRVIFQCKRYVGSVSSQQIRDFRGAMIGRADRGLFMTTGTFTRDAKQEANRDGAPAIDLIEGVDLVQRMKELGLGINIKMQEVVEVDKNWFKSF